MPYDNPTLKEFAGYFKAKEPGRRERADAWATAIGLQKVDGPTPSEHLYEIARRHIEGDISAAEARSLVDGYYETKEGRELPEDLCEADKVSARIIEVINDGGFGNVPEIAWNFYIGGYQPAQKWLKDRKGRTLSAEDIAHYRQIIHALLETDRLMHELSAIAGTWM